MLTERRLTADERVSRRGAQRRRQGTDHEEQQRRQAGLAQTVKIHEQEQPENSKRRHVGKDLPVERRVRTVGGNEPEVRDQRREHDHQQRSSQVLEPGVCGEPLGNGYQEREDGGNRQGGIEHARMLPAEHTPRVTESRPPCRRVRQKASEPVIPKVLGGSIDPTRSELYRGAVMMLFEITSWSLRLRPHRLTIQRPSAPKVYWAFAFSRA